MAKGHQRIRTAGCNLAAILAWNIICFVRANSGNSCIADGFRIKQFLATAEEKSFAYNQFWQQQRRSPLAIEQFWQQQRKISSCEGYFPFASAARTLLWRQISLFRSIFCFRGRRDVLCRSQNLLSKTTKVFWRRIFSFARGYFPLQEEIFLCRRIFPFAGGISVLPAEDLSLDPPLHY